MSVILTAGHPEATPVERMAAERVPSPLAQSQLGGGQEDGPTKQGSKEKKDVTMGTASTTTSSTSETVDGRCAGANSITIRERSRNMTTEKTNAESVNLQGPPTELSSGQQQRKRSGPKTREGKAKVRQNPVRHGLTARLPVIPGLERTEEWAAYRAAIVKSLSPEEGIQKVLAERIAQVSWRLNRAPRFEAWAISYATLEEGGRAALAMATRPAFTLPLSTEKDQNEIRSGEGNLGLSPFCLPDSSGLDRLSRYEAHLAKQRVQDLHELEALQARRRGERAPLARLDVTGLPESA